MKLNIRQCIGITIAVLDCTITSLLYGKGVHFLQHLSVDMSPFQFEISTVELWFMSILRSALLLGASIGVLINKTDGVKLLQKTSFSVFLVATVLAMFAIVKMLLCTEYMDVDTWFWTEFAWSLTGSVIFYIGFSLLLNVNCDANSSSRNMLINDVDEERRSLLYENQGADETTKNETDVNKARSTTKQKVSIVYRLISYSKPDVLYILIAFVFMVISSVCKCIHICCICKFASVLFK